MGKGLQATLPATMQVPSRPVKELCPLVPRPTLSSLVLLAPKDESTEGQMLGPGTPAASPSCLPQPQWLPICRSRPALGRHPALLTCCEPARSG